MKIEKIPSKKQRTEPLTRVISIASGKGGVGKTTVVTNLAVALAQQAKSVLVLDADMGLANVDVMLGIKPQGTLQDVIEGTRTLEEILVRGPAGIMIIPAASGVERMCALTNADRTALFQGLEELASRFDYLLIDNEAGIGADVMYFTSAAHEIVLIVNDEPTSLTDAYGLVKVLSQTYGEREVRVIVNQASDAQQGVTVFERFSKALERFLHVQSHYLGSIPRDEMAREAILSQRAVVEAFPSSRVSVAIQRIAQELLTEAPYVRPNGGVQFFFSQLMERTGL
jgi:flagellar biosynthesis protein FlhG